MSGLEVLRTRHTPNLTTVHMRTKEHQTSLQTYNPRLVSAPCQQRDPHDIFKTDARDRSPELKCPTAEAAKFRCAA